MQPVKKSASLIKKSDTAITLECTATKKPNTLARERVTTFTLSVTFIRKPGGMSAWRCEVVREWFHLVISNRTDTKKRSRMIRENNPTMKERNV